MGLKSSEASEIITLMSESRIVEPVKGRSIIVVRIRSHMIILSIYKFFYSSVKFLLCVIVVQVDHLIF